MPSSITCFTKILTLEISPFLFILVGVLCEFSMVPGVYILSSLRKKNYATLPEGTDAYTHIQQHIHQKYLNFCLTSSDYSKVIDELEKTQKKNSAVL